MIGSERLVARCELPLGRPFGADRGDWSCDTSAGLVMLGKVVGGDEGQDMGLQAFEVVVVEDIDRRVLDGAVRRQLDASIAEALTPAAENVSEAAE